MTFFFPVTDMQRGSKAVCFAIFACSVGLAACASSTEDEDDATPLWELLAAGDGRLIGASIGFACISAAAITVGIGGGGLFVPLLIVAFDFQISQATGLSQALIFGGTLAGLFLNLQQRHPVADRPAINLELILFMTPMLLSGALTGVILHAVLPDYFVLALVAIVLSYTAFKTFVQGFKLRKNEKEARAKIEAQSRRRVAEEAEEGDMGAVNGEGGGILDEEVGVRKAEGDGDRHSEDDNVARFSRERDVVGGAGGSPSQAARSSLGGVSDGGERESRAGRQGSFASAFSGVINRLFTEGDGIAISVDGTELGGGGGAPGMERRRSNVRTSSAPHISGLELRSNGSQAEVDPRGKGPSSVCSAPGPAHGAATMPAAVTNGRGSPAQRLSVVSNGEGAGSLPEIWEGEAEGEGGLLRADVEKGQTSPQTRGEKEDAAAAGASRGGHEEMENRSSETAADAPLSAEVKAMLEHDSKHNMRRWTYLLTVWGVTMAIQVSKSVLKTRVPFEVGCPVYWVLSLAAIVINFLMSFVFIRMSISEYARKSEAGYPFVEGDFEFRREAVVRLSVMFFVAGVISALMGIGGGLILGTLLLHVGFIPQVVTAANATSLIITSSSTAVTFALTGAAPWEYAVFLGACTFVGAAVGKFVLDRLVKKYKLASLLVILLAFLITFSLIAMLVFGSLNLVAQAEEDGGIRHFTFQKLATCNF
uniref:Membrane transporter protein n=1 Tax=Chromera velia CCMP2878 TaxID=1169474 RepID=A0A0G4G5J7_9ALVE|eukprot:Cvel_20223.t1-p1 / transcript=Cvel_20223.t1 / gene=Cvel_20223 / organism=Chromera_velia_CCMP2878 / gene_product=hypothetical protein / transcript_product=hypothetical protein / location=Cvel_scaffold1800:32387-37639(+) / protein_length=707 / sequence_SO=supercontig / SO=protein_coding / is_pseudo=false